VVALEDAGVLDGSDALAVATFKVQTLLIVLTR